MADAVSSFVVPWPPSVNHYWGPTRRPGQLRLLPAAKAYRGAVFAAVAQQRVPRPAATGRLRVQVVAFPPDRRVRDLDNVHKALLDALKFVGVITDDGHIDDLHIRRDAVVPQGEVRVWVSEINEVAA